MCNGKKRHLLEKKRQDGQLKQIRFGKNEGLPACLDGHQVL